MQHGGRLIVFEGISGSGKSSLMEKVGLLLGESEYEVTFRKWNENEKIEKIKRFLRTRKSNHPKLYSYVEWMGFLWSYFFRIKPSLKENNVVLCDRYVYTGISRDLSNLLVPRIGKRIHKRLWKSDVVIYLDESTEVCCSRIYTRGKSLYYTNKRLRSMRTSRNRDKEYLEICKSAYEQCFMDICKEDHLQIEKVESDIEVRYLYDMIKSYL